MGQALEMTRTNPVLKAHPHLTYRIGGFTYTVSTQGVRSIYSVSDGSQTISAPILWGFGAGAQTWLLSIDGNFYESLVSYFPSVHGLGITIGDEAAKPRTLVEALGRKLGSQDVKSCFGCHTTGAIVQNQLHLADFKPGVTCEHCHLGAAAHMVDATHRKYESAPPSLGDLSSENLSNFCGQCHRTWATVVTHRWFGELNVRFAPYRLANSRCFNGTDARISCLACHNPHENVVTSPAFYDKKCQACHAQSTSQTSASQLTRDQPALGKPCPVATKNCINCHMPKVKQADGHLTFTDHFIRIVKPGDAYPD